MSSGIAVLPIVKSRVISFESLPVGLRVRRDGSVDSVVAWLYAYAAISHRVYRGCDLWPAWLNLTKIVPPMPQDVATPVRKTDNVPDIDDVAA